MQVVLEPPMVPQPATAVSRAGPLAADEITHLGRRLPLDAPLAETHADGGQAGPGVGLADALRRVQDRIAAVFLPPVATAPRLILVVVQAGERGVEGLP